MRPIRADVCTVDSIVRACAALHNYLLCTDNAKYVPSGFADMCSDKGLVEGDWRALIRGDTTPALTKPKPPTARLASINQRGYNSCTNKTQTADR